MNRIFIEQVFASFHAAPRPNVNQIASHQCWECNRIKDDFSEFKAKEVPDNVMQYHGDSIPLLSPLAFRYFLPRYIEFTFTNPTSNAVDNVLFNLSPNDCESNFWKGRCDEFSKEECKSIISYLKNRREWDEAEIDEEWIEPGIEFWERLIANRTNAGAFN